MQPASLFLKGVPAYNVNLTYNNTFSNSDSLRSHVLSYICAAPFHNALISIDSLVMNKLWDVRTGA